MIEVERLGDRSARRGRDRVRLAVAYEFSVETTARTRVKRLGANIFFWVTARDE